VPLAAAPNIRYLARELGIELSAIQGSGRGGRIELMDLRHHIDALRAAAAGAVAVAPTAGPAPPPTAAAAAAPSAAAVMVDFARWGPVRRQPLTALRRTISQRMRESWSAVPRVTQFDQADVTGVLALRAAQAQAYEAKGARLTVTGFVLKAVAAALRKHPVLNASLDEAAGELVLKEYIHLGLAVDTGAGLLVPVIRDADKKSLFELSRELADLARRARERKLALEEMRGGTFTISNQGGIGSGACTPIINLPEVAILGLGRSVAQAVVRDGQIVARTLLPLAVSYDHRVIDGGTAARFTVDLVRALEQFPAAQAAL
jgi:pyruvate dehydrogenase E2 component (dihydrolipoamide acetyltransferase)